MIKDVRIPKFGAVDLRLKIQSLEQACASEREPGPCKAFTGLQLENKDSGAMFLSPPYHGWGKWNEYLAHREKKIEKNSKKIASAALHRR